MASDLCIKRNDCKWEIRDSPAKKQRCEGCASPPPPPSPSPSPSPLCSSASLNTSLNIYFMSLLIRNSKKPVFNLDEIVDDLKTFSELALNQYNDKELKNLEFVKVVKANMGCCAGFKYYITFDVKDADAVDGALSQGVVEDFMKVICTWSPSGSLEVSL
ncbi:hypothetical protein LOK49_LG11G00263 [Camellia lanceoleosa]|uniref:Uncharacterized protein n=1 Tax=Camellia lanceoleosa TaxID=1840588 RepID=A0ACC0G1M7_9ERIC|nr:hypothetical protein LOK49_LG11G00263 [Camellia lanceoleosa]